MPTRLRALLSLGLMRLIWLGSQPFCLHLPATRGYRSRICGGPLLGRILTLPRLERPAMLLGVYERQVVGAMRRYVQPGMTVYDVGAHAGYLTLLLARLVGVSGQVLACEPDPINVELLRQNLAENRRQNVDVLPLALSDQVGEALFAHFESYSLVGHLARANTPADASQVRVEMTTLDYLVYEEGKPAPDLIKLDVEGEELNVLYGARRLLAEVRPVVLAELRFALQAELFSYLAPLGYELHLLQGSIADWKRWGLADVLLLPALPDKAGNRARG